jgi:DNA recombination protein RmuC
MDLERALFHIGGSPVTSLHLAMTAAILALLLLVAAVVLSWRAQANRSAGLRRSAELEFRIAELSGALKGLIEQTQGSQMKLSAALDHRLDIVSERTGQSLKQLSERLAVIDAAQKNIEALSSEMLDLKDILSNKQARGAYGQARMEAIIRDGLPAGAFQFQGTLSNGTRPDCLVSLPDSAIKLVIDAKFPLEAFNAIKASRGENELRNAEARLRGDVLKHVKDIAEKYLIGGETHETAIMFVPSESVYAELYERFEDVLQKAHRARVIIASPNVLMLLVQTLQAIFKDARMREQAGLIKLEVTRLLDDVARLKERMGDLQKHFGAAAVDLEKLGVSADKVTRRGLRIESLDLQEEMEATRPKLVERG